LSLLTELRHALHNNELRLFLQPKVSTSTRRVVAAEALVRWQHPQRGLVPPLQFIPFAEQTGFVRQLTLWIFEEVARQWEGLQAPGEHLRIAINLSTRDLLDIDFPQRLAVLMQTYELDAHAFCLEITESAIMDDPQRAEATLNKLASQGFKLSIDDFGTGYSSLAYLKRLPVNELKIDKSFVMGMGTDQSDAKIVRSTIDLAHNLGLTVVAEGVENAGILDQLQALSCDEAQGYFVSKPMPAADFAAWRQRWYGLS
jgi:EAL domain-containing protein (putative c-di-GMP-specific phosphodiesterase class I)